MSTRQNLIAAAALSLFAVAGAQAATIDQNPTRAQVKAEAVAAAHTLAADPYAHGSAFPKVVVQPSLRSRADVKAEAANAANHQMPYAKNSTFADPYGRDLRDGGEFKAQGAARSRSEVHAEAVTAARELSNNPYYNRSLTDAAPTDNSDMPAF